jgi:hypothetical protein
VTALRLSKNIITRLTDRQGSKLGQQAEKMMTTIESKGTYGALGKEMFGINAPKMIRVRGWKEFWDSSISELGNTFGYFGMGFAISKVLNGLFKPLIGKEAFTLGKSIALNLLPASVLYAMPFIRNYISAQHVGSTRFLDVIGLGSLAPPQSKEEFEADERRYIKTAGFVLGGAALLSGLSVARGVVRARKGLAFASKGLTKSAASWFKKHFNFEGGQFSKMSSGTSLYFWGLPAYAGWMHASRDNTERVEVGIKAANFFIMFHFLDKWIQKIYGNGKTYNKELIQQLKTQQNQTKHVGRRLLKSTNISFTKANLKKAMTSLGYNQAQQAKYLRRWGVHKGLAYVTSTVGLFLSNYIASSLSILATKHQVERAKTKIGQEKINAFSHVGWESPVLSKYQQ